MALFPFQKPYYPLRLVGYMSKTEQLKEVKDGVLNFKDSPLYEERMKNKVFPVIGEGSHEASIMFIGEAPGKNEAATGKPFCGASGKILDKLLNSIGLDRKNVYVTNIVKDRPPFNRDPLPAEIEAYAPFLDKQIDIIQPKVLVTLGRFSMAYIMNRFGLSDQLGAISKIHGQTFNAKSSYGDIEIIPLYHPAVAVYNRTSLDVLTEDFKLLSQYK